MDYLEVKEAIAAALERERQLLPIAGGGHSHHSSKKHHKSSKDSWKSSSKKHHKSSKKHHKSSKKHHKSCS